MDIADHQMTCTKNSNNNSVCADDVTKLPAAMLEDCRNQNGD